MIFSKNLRDLKVNLKFFDYYRFFVDYYATIAKFLMRFKIKSFVNVFLKIVDEKHIFKKHVLSAATILITTTNHFYQFLIYLTKHLKSNCRQRLIA